MLSKKIVINARFLTQQTTGVQRFAIEISKKLKDSSLNIEFVAPKNIRHKELADLLNVKPIGFLKGHLWEQIELLSYVKKNKALLVSFCNTSPILLKNQIITIHDLGFRKHPEWYSYKFSFFYNLMVPTIIKKSKYIITVSNTSKDEIINEFNINPKKITVVYNAVSECLKEEPNIQSLDLDKKTLLKKDFILSVSSLNPRKNFKRLIQAFELLENKDVNLYIVGNINKNFLDLNLKSNDKIKILNNVTDAELVMFYKYAKLFVYPSLYEGFGIPIIEALSKKTPVCVSNIPVFKEICDSQALFFDPKDINDIKNKIEEALKTEKNCKVSSENQFSWVDSAKQIEFLIKKLL